MSLSPKSGRGDWIRTSDPLRPRQAEESFRSAVSRIICGVRRKVNLSHVFAGQNVGVTQVGERIWLVTFVQYDLGYFDDETCRLEPIENPFGSKLLPLRSE